MKAGAQGRRRLLRAAGALPLLPVVGAALFAPVRAQTVAGGRSRVRPGDAGWPAESRWQQLSAQLAEPLIKVRPPFQDCAAAPVGEACDRLFKAVKNPYFIGDDPALTQTLGWVDAWTSMPSAYAVAARRTDDVVAVGSERWSADGFTQLA